jgi:hypothetical protein
MFVNEQNISANFVYVIQFFQDMMESLNFAIHRVSHVFLRRTEELASSTLDV